jgi:hypothetical protein
MKRSIGWILIGLLGCSSAPPPPPELGPLSLREKWVYYPLDLAQKKNVDKLIGLFDRAAKVGFTTFLLEIPTSAACGSWTTSTSATSTGSKPRPRKKDRPRAGDVPGRPFGNLLSQDPNLAEGLPVRDQVFVVRGGVARVEPDPPLRSVRRGTTAIPPSPPAGSSATPKASSRASGRR